MIRFDFWHNGKRVLSFPHMPRTFTISPLGRIWIEGIPYEPPWDILCCIVNDNATAAWAAMGYCNFGGVERVYEND